MTIRSSLKRTLSLGFLLLGSGGCGFALDLRGGSLVNPENPLDEVAGRASRELSFRVYQLKQHENLLQTLAIPWEAFSGSELPEALKPFLAIPAEVPPQLRPREEFVIQRKQHKRIQFKLAKGTGALLVVARGRQAGDSSLQLIHVDTFDREASLCFYKYDVFKDPHNWPCARGESGDEE